MKVNSGYKKLKSCKCFFTLLRVSMISVYLKLYWSAFFNVRLQVKYLFFHTNLKWSSAHFNEFNANEILFYLLVIKDKRYDRLFKTFTIMSFYCKTKQVISNYKQRPTGCTTSFDNSGWRRGLTWLVMRPKLSAWCVIGPKLASWGVIYYLHKPVTSDFPFGFPWLVNIIWNQKHCRY